jgi:hypothetical protein
MLGMAVSGHSHLHFHSHCRYSRHCDARHLGRTRLVLRWHLRPYPGSGHYPHCDRGTPQLAPAAPAVEAATVELEAVEAVAFGSAQDLAQSGSRSSVSTHATTF